MKITLQLSNEEFEDLLVVSVNGETEELTVHNDQINFEVSDTNEITVRVEYKRNDILQIKNPIGRFFAYLLFSLFSIIIFFVNNDNGISIHRFFDDATPLEFEKTFNIRPTDSTLKLKYIPSKYNKKSKKFSEPDIELLDAEITKETVLCEYNHMSFKKDFRLYHYPAYIALFLIMSALTVLTINLLVSQFSPFNLFGVLGMLLGVLVIVVLLIIFIVLFVYTHRLFRDIDCNLRLDFNKK